MRRAGYVEHTGEILNGGVKKLLGGKYEY